MTDDNIIPIPRKIIATVGGVVDESSATLCIYGESLEPDEVSDLLGTQPTNSFRRGYQKVPRSQPMPHGAWFLRVEGQSPKGPGEHIHELLLRLPTSTKIWAELRERYTAKVSVAIHMVGWNKGFELQATQIERLASLGLHLDFDIYTYDEEEGK